MRIFNEDKTKELSKVDEELGRLKNDMLGDEDILVYVLYDEETIQRKKLRRLRGKRKALLEAFDKWEKGVLRGREEDTVEVMEWYKSILDLDEEALQTIPIRIQYYL